MTESSPTVLVVDDDEATRVELVEILASEGWPVVSANDGVHALILVERHSSIRVMVADVAMPLMDGLTLVGELRRLTVRPRLPRVIFLSGRQAYTDAVTALRLGAQDFLTKPVSPSALLDSVRRTLAISEAPPALADADFESQEAQLRMIRSLITARKLRNRTVNADLFNDPCWDMLLELYAATLEGKESYLTGLCFAAGVPLTTATRRFDDLVDAGLVSKKVDAADRRRMIVSLTPDGRNRLELYLQGMRRQQAAGAATAPPLQNAGPRA